METNLSQKDKFWRLLFTLAIPIALQNLLISSLSLVDTLFMGQLGDIPLAAAGMANQCSWLLSIALFGINSGSALFMAQFWGVRDTKSIHRVYGIQLTCAVIISAIFFTLGFFIPEVVLKCFNRDPAVVECGVRYIKIAAFSYPALAINNALCTVLRSTERVKLPLVVSAITTFMNIFLDYALMFGKFSFPEMGVEGAALATAISAWCGVLVNIVVSVCQKNILIAKPSEIFHFDKNLLANFALRAAPASINELMWGLGTVATNMIYSNTGHENYAAVTILRTVESICFTFFIGFNDGGAVIVGNEIGSGRIKDAIRDTKRLALFVPILSCFVGAAAIIFRIPIIHLFNLSGNITAHTLSIASIIMIIYACELPIRNIPYIMVCGIFRPGGDTVIGAKLDILCLWVIAVPTTLAAAFLLKLPFPIVFLTAYVFEDFLKVILCIRHFVSLKWLKPVTEEGARELAAHLKERG